MGGQPPPLRARRDLGDGQAQLDPGQALTNKRVVDRPLRAGPGCAGPVENGADRGLVDTHDVGGDVGRTARSRFAFFLLYRARPSLRYPVLDIERSVDDGPAV